MAKTKIQVQNIEEALKTFSKEKFLPVYLFFGEDTYNIDLIFSELEKAVSPLILSDFDKEIIYGEDKTALDIINLASSFPFGSDKKLIVVKEFDKIKDKKNFTSYVNNPSPFTIVVLLGSPDLTIGESEPYKSMNKYGYLFESKELKGYRLIDWLTSYTQKRGKILSKDNAQILTDISGEKRDILEAQLEKIFLFLGDKKEIDFKVIESLSASLKEHNIFDLQNALGRKDAKTSLKVAYNLLEKGTDITQILYMLTRYFTGLSRIKELMETRVDEQTAARIVGTNYYFYKDYLSAHKLYSNKDLVRSVRALLNADIQVKTSVTDPKTIITILISEILKK